MAAAIILIGPMGAGKSTLGRLLADRLGRPYRALDAVGERYYREVGYDPALEQRRRAAAGVLAALRYRAPFNLHAVERCLAEHRDGVIDFGAGHSVYDDPALLARAGQILAPYDNVVLVLPSPDVAESVRILHARRPLAPDRGVDLHAYAVSHPANHALAKLVVYTQGKTPEETRDAILALTKW